MSRKYKFHDQQYQLNNNKYGAPNFGSNTFTEAVNINREYGLTYDANGNIKTLNRTNTAGNVVNNFSYNYQSNTNKLSSVSNYAEYEYDDLGQLTHQQKGTAQAYLSYDVSGKVIAIYADAARTQLKQSFAYDEAGIRIRKTDHSNNITTYYMSDAGGNVMAIYDNNGTALQQKEIPVYAADRIGRYLKTNNSYQYELTDHLGNVRVVINQNKINGQADVLYYSDYYPFGSPLTLANNDYRYGYQGQYAEADKENNWNAFELRNYDAAIGRWLSTDPYGEHWSPYLAMSNNPVIKVDPDGGCDSCPGGDEVYANGATVTNKYGSWEYLGGGSWKDLSESTFKGSAFSMDFAQSGGGMNTANDWLGYAGHGEAGLSAVQMGMMEYRQSLSINSRIGTFGSFSSTYRALGTTGKVLGGAATYVGAPLNTYLDYKSMKNGEIGGGRFGYRTAGTAVGIGVGAYFGAIPGAVIGGGVWAGEKMYDGYMYWQTQMSIYLTNFENGLKSGWVPGR